MPRPNPPRADEDHLADRVAYEREARQMSYAGLAKRMSDLGCPINQSALYKIEKGSPRRTVSYAEARTLARVFEIPLDQLSVPPDLIEETAVVELVQRWAEKADALVALGNELDSIMTGLGDRLRARPHLERPARQYLEAWWGSAAPKSETAPERSAELLTDILKGDAEFLWFVKKKET